MVKSKGADNLINQFSKNFFIVAEIMPLLHHVLRVKVKSRFLALPVEVVKDAQLFLRVQFGAFGAKGGEMGNKVGSYAGKIRPRFFNILFHYR